MGLSDLLSSGIQAVSSGNTDALVAAGEQTLGDAVGGILKPKPAATPTANVTPTPGTAPSPVASNPNQKINVPFFGPVTTTAAIVGGLAVVALAWWMLKKR